jgi:hypothetical protein
LHINLVVPSQQLVDGWHTLHKILDSRCRVIGALGPCRKGIHLNYARRHRCGGGLPVSPSMWGKPPQSPSGCRHLGGAVSIADGRWDAAMAGVGGGTGQRSSNSHRPPLSSPRPRRGATARMHQNKLLMHRNLCIQVQKAKLSLTGCINFLNQNCIETIVA